FKLMEATWAEPEQATKALLPSGRIAISVGSRQIETVLRTESFATSISETESLARLLTTIVLPSGETRASPGELPTRIAPITFRWSRSMTEMFSEAEFATYARLPSPETSMK